MARYRFYPPADARQDEIWRYTVKTWSVEQAKVYIRGLHDHLQKLADEELFWHRLPRRLVVPTDLKIETYLSRYEKHYIFFRELSDGIGVMSILHENMNMPVRLKEDLQRLQKDVDEKE